MKKILFILLIIISSCSEQDDITYVEECGCVKETFVSYDSTSVNNGLPTTRTVHVLLSREDVKTCDEQKPTMISIDRWYRILCNKN